MKTHEIKSHAIDQKNKNFVLLHTSHVFQPFQVLGMWKVEMPKILPLTTADHIFNHKKMLVDDKSPLKDFARHSISANPFLDYF